MKNFTAILVLLFITFRAHTQIMNRVSPYYITIDDTKGLPSNEVYQIIQDKKGYMWLGCDAGLYRYDGQKFKAYTNAKQNSRSISHLNFDGNMDLWCQNFSGQVFKVVNDTLKLIADYSNETTRYQIAFYDKPGFWRITKNALELNNEKGKITHTLPLHFTDKQLNSAVDLYYYKNQLWLEIPYSGLYCYDIKKNNLELVLPADTTTEITSQRLFVFNKELYLLRGENEPTHKNTIYTIDPKTKSWKVAYTFVNPGQVRNYSFYQDKQDRLWIGTSLGAICVHHVYLFTFPEYFLFFGNNVS